MKKIVIAIDGFSSSGKSTMAKELANYASYVYVDTGAMYRALALYGVEHGWITDTDIDQDALQKHISDALITFHANNEGKQETYLNGRNIEQQIRSLTIGNAASRVSTIGFVRQELVRQQQRMGEAKGVVMDGRDIGTVVFPDAELKVFVTASAEVRAKRRFLELQEKGTPESYEAVLSNIRERDTRDTTREESPLYPADDARLLDNSELTIEAQRQLLFKWFDEVVSAE